MRRAQEPEKQLSISAHLHGYTRLYAELMASQPLLLYLIVLGASWMIASGRHNTYSCCTVSRVQGKVLTARVSCCAFWYSRYKAAPQTKTKSQST